MKIRPARMTGLDSIMKIYQYARRFMIEMGNTTQWKCNYPSRNIVEEDTFSGNFYVCERAAEIIGVFTFIIGEDKTYNQIDGEWHSNNTYGTIHRLASAGTVKGVSKFCFAFCKEHIDYKRIDTHKDNIIMKKVLLDNGFKVCGIIYVRDGSPRIAFDYINKK